MHICHEMLIGFVNDTNDRVWFMVSYSTSAELGSRRVDYAVRK